MWRTPHPDPNPLDGPTTGLSGAVAVAMAYLTDGTVVFAERPHPLAPGITNNPLIVNVSALTAAVPAFVSPAVRQSLMSLAGHACRAGHA